MSTHSKHMKGARRRAKELKRLLKKKKVSVRQKPDGKLVIERTTDMTDIIGVNGNAIGRPGTSIFIVVDSGTRQVILEDRMGDDVDFAAYCATLREKARSDGFIVTSPSHDMETTTFVGPGMSLTVLTEERFQQQQDRARLMQRV